MMGRWAVGVVVLFGILLTLLPKTDDASVAKIGSASMLMCTLKFREEVEAQLLRGQSLTAEFNNGCPDLIADLNMDEGGKMVITGKKHPVTMTLQPVMDGGKVRWSCRGEPVEFITRLCKP